jgi:hypothetical protein
MAQDMNQYTQGLAQRFKDNFQPSPAHASPRNHFMQARALVPQAGAQLKVAKATSVNTLAKLHTSRDNAGRQSHSVGSLSTTAASTPGSVSGRNPSAPPGVSPSSAQAPPAVRPAWQVRDVGVRGKLMAQPSQLTVQNGKNVIPRQGLSPEREAYKNLALAEQRGGNKAVSPTRMGIGANSAASSGHHTQSAPTMGQTGDRQMPPSSSASTQVLKAGAPPPSLSAAAQMSASSTFSPAKSSRAQMTTPQMKNLSSFQTTQRGGPDVHRQSVGSKGTGTSERRVHSDPTNVRSPAQATQVKQDPLRAKASQQPTKAPTSYSHQPPGVRPIRSQQDSQTPLSSSRCHSQPGATQAGAPYSRPLVANPQTAQRHPNSRATVPTVRQSPSSVVSHGHSPHAVHEVGSPMGGGTVPTSSVTRSQATIQMNTSRGRSSSPAYLGDTAPPNSNPTTARR